MNNKKMDKIVAEVHRNRVIREEQYRTKALKMFPWVCGRCGRDFEGKRLRELTVHHRDHNHDNNPPDGSNWELLCIYCHDNEHSRVEVAELSYFKENISSEEEVDSLRHNPFAKLANMLKEEKLK